MTRRLAIALVAILGGALLCLAGVAGSANRAAQVSAATVATATPVPSPYCAEDDRCFTGAPERTPDEDFAEGLGGSCSPEECMVPMVLDVPDSYPCNIGSVDWADRSDATCWIMPNYGEGNGR